MNMNSLGYVGSNLAGAAIGTGIALGGSAIYKNVTGKPGGAPASIAHVFTNDKLDSKTAVLGEQLKESVKDTVTLGKITVGAGLAGSLAVANSNKCAEAFKSMMTKASDVLANSNINGKNVKDLITNTKVYEKIKGLPTAAKAGIVAGATAFALVAPLVQMVSCQKAGYIEGKHEVK